jgi:glycosyltransferase involved in cell wall biosynthesis
MRLLFVKQALAWPRSSGHDVHTYYMMKALRGLGHTLGLATVQPVTEAALEGLNLERVFNVDAAAAPNGAILSDSRLQRRFRSFWGVSEGQILAVRRLADEFRADTVIVSGLDALPYFPALSGMTRVWYAADEWMLHHLTQIQWRRGHVVAPLKAAAIKGVYERAYRKVIDRVWVVSEADRRAMRWGAGMAAVDVLPNGVDGDYFRPCDEVPEPRTAAFWGRLDFGPNVQALEWFCRRVWPLVRQQVPDARFTIIGFQPLPAVRELASGAGITLVSDLADLRPTARRHSVAVLPFVSGAGIKNKLLEAAAMALPIACTPTATRGLRGNPPLVVASSPSSLASDLARLWQDESRRRRLAADARRWVLEHHTWEATARDAAAGLAASRVGADAP